MRVLLLSLAALSLSGCATAKLTPEQIHQLFVDFKDAGCKGSAGFDVGASTGQLGGEAHASARANGDCDPANAPNAVLKFTSPETGTTVYQP